jgi:hypothetical protein
MRAAFFDLGDTLGTPVLSAPPIHLIGFDVFDFSVPALHQLGTHGGLRLGVISNTGSDDGTAVDEVLERAGIRDFFEPALRIYSRDVGLRKDSPAIFLLAAARAGVDPGECLFVGEDAAERGFAEQAGFHTADHPGAAWAVVEEQRRTGPGRLDAVVITTVLTGLPADRAAVVLGLSGPGELRPVYYAEDLRADGALPLLDAGVILRARRTLGGDDTTVELTPCDRARLTPPWLALTTDAGHRFRIEEAWAGERKVLAAALTAAHDPGDLDDVVAGKDSPAVLFTDRHRRLLAECAAVEPDLDAVTVLGPVRVGTWRTVSWEGFEVDAERWVLEPLDILELSVRVEPDAAPVAQEEFAAALSRHGIEGAAMSETVTQMILRQLAADRGITPADAG